MKSLRKVTGLSMFAFLACVPWNFALAPIEGQDSAAKPSPADTRQPLNYRLGPDDEVTIIAIHADDLSNKPFRISKSGDLNLPTVGSIHAEGMTVEGLVTEVKERLSTLIKVPDVVINVTQFRSQPVTVYGYVASPGEVQLEGQMTLIEVLAKRGGLSPAHGPRIQIRRQIEMGPIPLPSAVTDGQFSIAEVSALSLEKGSNPVDNIQILPHDFIFIARADFVYVIGSAMKPGAYALDDMKTINLIDLLGRVGGTAPNAAKKNATIYRKLPDGSHTSISVNIDEVKNKVKKGRPQVVMLQAEDILDIPDSYAKGAVRRTLDQALSTVTALAIYRPF
jgi:polysaccharide export outer membrane protein